MIDSAGLEVFVGLYCIERETRSPASNYLGTMQNSYEERESEYEADSVDREIVTQELGRGLRSQWEHNNCNWSIEV